MTLSAKGPHAFRTISETADSLGVQQHVLRFWETKFTFVRPTKRAGGRRFYRPQDIVLLQGIKALLHDRGYTIRGVQKLHKDHGQKAIFAAAGGEFTDDVYIDDLPSAVAADIRDAVITPGAFSGSLMPDLDVKGQFSASSRAALADILGGLETAQARLAAALGK